MNEFLFSTAYAAGAIANAPSVSRILMNVLFFLLSVVGIVAILSLVIAGLRYMLAFGEVSQAASAKQMAAQSIIGIAIAFGALILLQWIKSFFV